MSFDALLGNEQLKTDLARSLQTGHISHCYLITGPQGSGKHTLARLLAAAILCQGRDKPCGVCHPCRKVLEGGHPDFITWEDPDYQKIPVKLIRETFRPDVFIKPNESEHKIYMISQELGLEGQNALLTILEEPPAYAVFLLLADNPQKLLPTVRSRCRELKLSALPRQLLEDRLSRDFPQASREDLRRAAERSGGFLGQAKALLEEGLSLPPQTAAFVRAFAGGDALALTELLVPMEKWKRDALIPVLSGWLALLEEALAGYREISTLAGEIAARRTAPDIYRAIQALQKALTYAQGNVSPGAICGWLAWALR